jgi:hypothetical protein
MPSQAKVDNAILAATSTNWSKVAMVLARVSRSQELTWHEEEDEFEIIAARIQAMVQAGLLVSQGNLAEWRHSEARKP